jgi:hypothetical protein
MLEQNRCLKLESTFAKHHKQRVAGGLFLPHTPRLGLEVGAVHLIPVTRVEGSCVFGSEDRHA